VNLIVGDKQSVPRYICRFAGHFPKVVDRLGVADIEVVHSAIERIVGLTITKEYEEAFVQILPPTTEFILKADIPPRIADMLVLPEKQLLLSLGKKPSLATARIIVDYALACATANPMFCESLGIAIRQNVPRLSFQSVPIPQVILASGLVLAEKTQDDRAVVAQLASLFAPIQQQAVDASLDEMYKFYAEVSFPIRSWVVPFAIVLFLEAKLGNAAERMYFEAVFQRFAEEEIAELFGRVAGAFQKYSHQKDRGLLLVVRRAGFITATWPERRGQLLGLIPSGVVESFPKKTKDWTSAMADLLGE
jgi:hypothetical protein